MLYRTRHVSFRREREGKSVQTAGRRSNWQLAQNVRANAHAFLCEAAGAAVATFPGLPTIGEEGDFTDAAAILLIIRKAIDNASLESEREAET